MLNIAGRREVVSLDHIKLAYLESNLFTDVDTSTQTASTVQPTKSLVIHYDHWGGNTKENAMPEVATPKVSKPTSSASNDWA